MASIDDSSPMALTEYETFKKTSRYPNDFWWFFHSGLRWPYMAKPAPFSWLVRLLSYGASSALGCVLHNATHHRQYSSKFMLAAAVITAVLALWFETKVLSRYPGVKAFLEQDLLVNLKSGAHVLQPTQVWCVVAHRLNILRHLLELYPDLVAGRKALVYHKEPVQQTKLQIKVEALLERIRALVAVDGESGDPQDQITRLEESHARYMACIDDLWDLIDEGIDESSKFHAAGDLIDEVIDEVDEDTEDQPEATVSSEISDSSDGTNDGQADNHAVAENRRLKGQDAEIVENEQAEDD